MSPARSGCGTAEQARGVELRRLPAMSVTKGINTESAHRGLCRLCARIEDKSESTARRARRSQCNGPSICPPWLPVRPMKCEAPRTTADVESKAHSKDAWANTGAERRKILCHTFNLPGTAIIPHSLGATLRPGQHFRTMLQQGSHGGCASGYALHIVRQWNHRLVYPEAITLSQLTCKSGSKGLT